MVADDGQTASAVAKRENRTMVDSVIELFGDRWQHWWYVRASQAFTDLTKSSAIR